MSLGDSIAPPRWTRRIACRTSPRELVFSKNLVTPALSASWNVASSSNDVKAMIRTGPSTASRVRTTTIAAINHHCRGANRISGPCPQFAESLNAVFIILLDRLVARTRTATRKPSVIRGANSSMSPTASRFRQPRIVASRPAVSSTGKWSCRRSGHRGCRGR